MFKLILLIFFMLACQSEDELIATTQSGAEAELNGGSIDIAPMSGAESDTKPTMDAGAETAGGVAGAGVEMEAGAGAGAGVVGGSGGEPSVSFEPGYALYPAEGELLTRTATFNSSLTLSARYTFSDGETIAGVPAQAITLRLLDPTGSDRTATGYLGSRLQSSRVFSTDQGLISFNLFIGDQEGSFTIEVSALDAMPLSFVINVIAEG